MITRRSAILAGAAMPLAGCAALSFFATPAGTMVVTAAVDGAVGIVLHAAGANGTSLALQLQSAAKTLSGVVSGTSATLSDLEATLAAKIDAAHFSPFVDGALKDILALATAAMEGGSMLVPAQATMALNTVCTNIESTCSAFLAMGKSDKARGVLMRMKSG